MTKEQNFISAVVYMTDDSSETLAFLKKLYNCLDEHFLQYEIIAVNAFGEKNIGVELKEWAKSIDKPLTLVHMSSGQAHEQCMNAGLDIAIGDYVFEFDNAELTYPVEIIYKSYEEALQGNDIVTVCPQKEKIVSKIFYSIFNHHSGSTRKLRTDVFRLVSRRALNRAHAMNENLPYRKAAYASCGLKSAELEFVPVKKQSIKSEHPTELALNSLILYTDFGYRFSLTFSLLMLTGTLLMGIYTLITYLVGNPVSGWTTTMLALTAGLTGIFAILTVVLKYLDLVLKLIFKNQKYLVENIEKL